MKIKDSIYGEFHVEPIFEKIIKTKEFQRLKKIHQGGASYLINEKWNVTRYEHSIGVMLFIRLMGGSIKEQIAGLLHDVSHTAFSHVADFALKNQEEDYHEKIYKDIIEKSDIPSILTGEGYDYRDILFNEAKWTILEKSAPRLCADRIDYTLRDMYHYGYISKREVDEFLKSLSIHDGEVVITSIKKAEWFVNTYYKEVIDFFMNPLNVYANDRLAKAISTALGLKKIRLEDLLMDDDYVYKLLLKSESMEVLNLLESIRANVNLIESKSEYDIYQKCKLRIIDPTIVLNNEIFITSEKSKISWQLTCRALEKTKEGVYIKISS